jgi:hypothetical protein
MLHMNTNKVGNGMYQYYDYSKTSPKTTNKKTTTTKKKFDKDGRVVSETTTIYEEVVTTYDYPYYYTTNTRPLGEVKYGSSSSLTEH